MVESTRELVDKVERDLIENCFQRLKNSSPGPVWAGAPTPKLTVIILALLFLEAGIVIIPIRR
jgi:hypothetical protein